ncbi:serine protease [Streptomyces sp. LP11]|uniref:Serine protease n=1 Tax=Streptomyces pyxinicus TaxID=2970331 RepID=A0ABT2AYM9_9ACTN|nr:serine protease [Streptomyces sp. LP11]MCS0601359.1 serine protease [Streptomyces sp. LP11]
MRSAAWHARVACGPEVGAGFLVTDRLVLTCAHVVAYGDRRPVTVTFPHAPALSTLSASVVAEGGWAGAVTDPGDLAVLELDRPVPLAPARFAPPDTACAEPYPKLVVYGFPEGYDEGTLAEYQVVSGQLIAGEWLELVAWSGHGQPLVGGFSGAAATLPDGRVAGLVTAAVGTVDVRKGRMLPLEVMARYWPPLGEFVPTAGHPDAVRHRLHTLLRRAAATGRAPDPHRLYGDAVGPFGPPLPPGGFPSLAAAAGYVQWEVPAPEATTRFAERLGELLEGGAAPAAAPVPAAVPAPVAAAVPAGIPARAGAPEPVGGPLTPPPLAAKSPAPVWAPVVVEVEHSGAGPDQVTVEVSAYRDGRRRPVGVQRLPRAGVRAWVQRRIDEAVDQLAPDAEELVTFVLPREWLNEAVAHWECGTEDSTPLGCAYPLVVTDRVRHHSGRLRHQLRKRWQRLDDGRGAELHRVGCGTAERPPSLRKRLWDGEAGLAGYAAPPAAVRQHFEVGLTVPVPVLLWSRTGCDREGHAGPPCPGDAFLDQLTASLAGVPLTELPRHVMELRLTAAAADEPDRHWARDLQLLWDDPRCFPETTASLHSPVA